jgi:flagellar biogenesis protein FliO
MEYGEHLMAAAAVPGALGAVLWWLRRRGWAAARPRAAVRRLQSMERLALAPQHTLHLVRVGEEALLVACSPAGCTLLDRVPPRPMAEPAAARS